MATGTVITDMSKSHISVDFVAFLNKVNREVFKELDVHVILDNLSTYKITLVYKWLLRHRRFHFHFTPTYGSWMNMVKRWFSALTTKKLQALRASQRQRTGGRHLGPGPTPGTRTHARSCGPRSAEQILERLAGYCAAINTSK